MEIHSIHTMDIANNALENNVLEFFLEKFKM